MLDKYIKNGKCLDFSPTFNAPLEEDWFNMDQGWVYEGNTITYRGKGTPRDKHFWLWFWKKDRWWVNFGLIKKNYFCAKTEIRGLISLGSAEEAGFMFRIRGSWDFFSILVAANEISINRMYLGERKKLATRGYSNTGTLAVVVADQIADIVVDFGPSFENTESFEHVMEDVKEISDEHQGGAGLVSYKGSATFSNVVIGNVNWNSKKVNPEKLLKDKTSTTTNTTTEIFVDYELLAQWCPCPSICCNQQKLKKITETQKKQEIKEIRQIVNTKEELIQANQIQPKINYITYLEDLQKKKHNI